MFYLSNSYLFSSVLNSKDNNNNVANNIKKMIVCYTPVIQLQYTVTLVAFGKR